MPARKKLFDEDFCQLYYKADHICSSWQTFIKNKPYDGNATCPIQIIAWSWVSEDSSSEDSYDEEKIPENESLYLVCKYWSSCDTHFPTFIFKIVDIKREDEPEIRKFIKNNLYKIRL